MATYAQYPAQAMATDDFTLYALPETWNSEQPYLPTSSYSDQPYLSASGYDPYQSEHTFAPFPDQFAFEEEEDKIPTYSSPANSISHTFDLANPPRLSSSDSGHSSLSSAMGSPIPPHTQSEEWSQLAAFPEIAHQRDGTVFTAAPFDCDSMPATEKGCVDPSLIQPFSEAFMTGSHLIEPAFSAHSPLPNPYPAISPVPSRQSLHADRSQSGIASPNQSWDPYPAQRNIRRPSISSIHSKHSQQSHSSDDSNKGLCPMASCGRHVKDLKAHMLTHQNERPEKCPIPTCEYHIKGFARKYDKNRHTLTHYKGNMVCGFCPGSGSAAEKSFNRADVFKRHLTSVHGVEQTPPNARRKSPVTTSKKSQGPAREASGMCSTCGNNFASAQDFYEHLDDCVLRVVQQADPCEANNERLLTEISLDRDVQETMEKHNLPTDVDLSAPVSFDDDEECDDDEDAEGEDDNDGTYGKRIGRAGKRVGRNGAVLKPGQKKGSSSRGPFAAATGKGSKRRRNYPLSWGAAPDKMRMKKRVLCIYDGQRQLWKDDMMLDTSHEVRIPLDKDGRSYVTDLDLMTLRRAEALHNATEEEKGPWVKDEQELERLMS